MKLKLIILINMIFVILLTAFVSAPGVTPAYYIVDFQPNFEDSFVFNFVFDENSNITTYVSGDLAEYVELDRDSLKGRGEVIAYLKLPDKIDKFGEHRIRIGAKQLPEEAGGLEVIGDVGGIIKVNVPYLGKHIEGNLYIRNANIGEEIEIKLIIKNNGGENVYVKPVVRIYNSGNSDKEVKVLEFDEKEVEKTKSVEYIKLLGTEDFDAANYSASAVINYDGEELELETDFQLGEVYVKIIDYTKEFERDKINRFEINVQSFSNNLIKDLYANVSILDEDVSFLTPSIDLMRWEAGKLEGFFDTASIKSRKFKAEIVLHYDGRTTSKVVKLKYAGEVDFLWYFGGGAVLALIFGFILWFLRKKQWHMKSKNKKRKT
tara:strand:+ start:566 stop:1696 length:1131 start_codon:yes stop_codon:yes gene_type:complete